eukprot:scaffold1499_cov255-Pinguiococcus_pyrenoidosus.AAC.34
MLDPFEAGQALPPAFAANGRGRRDAFLLRRRGRRLHCQRRSLRASFHLGCLGRLRRLVRGLGLLQLADDALEEVLGLLGRHGGRKEEAELPLSPVLELREVVRGERAFRGRAQAGVDHHFLGGQDPRHHAVLLPVVAEHVQLRPLTVSLWTPLHLRRAVHLVHHHLRAVDTLFLVLLADTPQRRCGRQAGRGARRADLRVRRRRGPKQLTTRPMDRCPGTSCSQSGRALGAPAYVDDSDADVTPHGVMEGSVGRGRLRRERCTFWREGERCA